MSLVLELLQWAVIVFLGVMVFGLARQLGAFLVPHREQLEHQGPQVGQRLKGPFVEQSVGDAVVAAMRQSGAESAVLLVVDQHCAGCRAVIEDVEKLSATSERLVPIAAVVKSAGVTFLAEARELFDVVIEDPDGSRSSSAGVLVTPHALVVDDDLRVEQVVSAAGIAQLVPTWFAGAPEPNPIAVIASPVAASIDNSQSEVQHD